MTENRNDPAVWAQRVSGAAESLDALIYRLAEDPALRTERQLLRSVCDALKVLAEDIAGIQEPELHDEGGRLRNMSRTVVLALGLASGVATGVGQHMGTEVVGPALTAVFEAEKATLAFEISLGAEGEPSVLDLPESPVGVPSIDLTAEPEELAVSQTNRGDSRRTKDIGESGRGAPSEPRERRTPGLGA